MSENILVTFALLFGATIALVCSVYVFLIMRNLIMRNKKAQELKDNKEL